VKQSGRRGSRKRKGGIAEGRDVDDGGGEFCLFLLDFFARDGGGRR